MGMLVKGTYQPISVSVSEPVRPLHHESMVIVVEKGESADGTSGHTGARLVLRLRANRHT